MMRYPTSAKTPLLRLINREGQLGFPIVPGGVSLTVSFDCPTCGQVFQKIDLYHEVNEAAVEAFRNLARQAHQLCHKA